MNYGEPAQLRAFSGPPDEKNLEKKTVWTQPDGVKLESFLYKVRANFLILKEVCQ
jgi:hypothetical protein